MIKFFFLVIIFSFATFVAAEDAYLKIHVTDVFSNDLSGMKIELNRIDSFGSWGYSLNPYTDENGERIVKIIFPSGSNNTISFIISAEISTENISNTWAKQYFTNNITAYGATPVWIYQCKTTDVVLVMQHPSGWLCGKLINKKTGQVLSDSIKVYEFESGIEASCIVENNEDFSVSGLMPGKYVLYSSSYNVFYPSAPALFFAQPIEVFAGETTRVEFAVSGASISGTVVDELDPSLIISNGYVWIVGIDGAGSDYKRLSNGTFEFDNVSVGKYYLYTDYIEYSDRDYAKTYYSNAISTVGATILNIQNKKNLNVEIKAVRKPVVITGNVKFGIKDIENVNITFINTNGGNFYTKTSSNGVYSLNIPYGGYYAYANKTNFLDVYYPNADKKENAEILNFYNPGTSVYNFSLDNGATIQGRVFDTNSITGVSNAFVCVIQSSDPSIIWYAMFYNFPFNFRFLENAVERYDFTDAQGNYSFSGLCTNSYKVWVAEVKDYGRNRYLIKDSFYYISTRDFYDSQNIILDSHNDIKNNINIIKPEPFQYPTQFISGVVLDKLNDQSIGNVSVIAKETRDRYSRTDISGNFSIGVFNSQNCTMVFQKTGYQTLTTNLNNYAEHTIQLDRQEMMKGQIRANCDIIGWYDTYVSIINTNEPYEVFSTVSIKYNGKFEIKAPKESDFVVLAYKENPINYASTFAGDTFELSKATVYNLPNGIWTNIIINMQKRPESTSTTIYHEIEEKIVVQINDIPHTFFIDNNILTSEFYWQTWNMPNNASFDENSREFSWTSDGEEYDVAIGRFSNKLNLENKGGSGSNLKLEPIPEPNTILFIFVTFLGVYYEKQKTCCYRYWW